jgi:hypothetical protein
MSDNKENEEIKKELIKLNRVHNVNEPKNEKKDDKKEVKKEIKKEDKKKNK